MADKLTVVDVRKLPSPDPGRMGKTDMMVIYELGPGQRFVTRLPAEDFNEDKLKEAVRKDMAERGQWIGKEIDMGA